MAGAPSQLDTFDYKPQMDDWFDKDLPESVRKGQRLTTMTASQARFPIAPSMFKFNQYGECGRWVSESLPHKREYRACPRGAQFITMNSGKLRFNEPRP